MATALASSGGAQKTAGAPQTDASENIYLNRKLREAFGILTNPKDTPAPKSKNSAASLKLPATNATANSAKTGNPAAPAAVASPSKNSSQPIVAPLPAAPQPAAGTKLPPAQTVQTNKDSEELRKAEEQKRDEEEKKRRAEEQKRDEEEKKLIQERQKREDDQKRDEERKKQEEEQKKAEEKIKADEQLRLQKEAKAAEEKKRQEKEREIAQEKIRQEKLRLQAERDRLREEKRRRLAVLEAEREKKWAEEREKSAAVPANGGGTPSLNDDEEKLKTENLSSCLQALSEKLRAKKSDFERQLAGLPALKEPLQQKKSALEEKISSIKNNELAAAESKEKEIEEKETEEKAKANGKLTAQEEKDLDQRLWAIGEQRKESEKKRWEIEDRINNIIAETEKINSEIKKKDDDAELVKQKIRDIANKEKLVGFAVEKGKLEEEMLGNIAEKDGLMPLLEAANNKKTSAEASLKESSEKQDITNAELNAIEQKEKQATDPKEKRAAEQDRWRINDALKSIIQSKWKNEEKLKEIAAETQLLQNKIDTVNAKINGIQSKISNSEIALEKTGLPARKIRDSISSLFKENGMEIDPDILKDITQTEDDQKKQPAPENKVANAPAPAPAVLASEKPQTPPSNTLKNDAVRPTVPEIKTKETENAQTGPEDTAKNIDVKPDAQETTPSKTAEAKKITSPQKTLNEGIIWKPETRLNDVAKTADINAAKPAEENLPAKKAADTEKASFKTATVYREHVESSPASNFRTFPKENIEKDAPPAAIRNGVNPADIPQTTFRKKIDIQPEADAKPEEAGPNNPENRWNQIKKTTAAVPAVASPVIASAPETNTPLSAQLEPKPSEKNKILPRVLVVLAIVGILAVILVIVLTKDNAPAATKTPAATDSTETVKNNKVPAATDSKDGETKKDTNSSPLAVISTIPILTEDLASVPNLISPSLQKSLGANGYYRVTIQNKKDNTKVGLRQFFNIYKVNAPALFYASVSDDFTLFIYSNNGRNRIGFVAPITDSKTLATAVEGWEGSMMQDTANLFKLLGRKTQTQTDNIRFTSSSTPSGAEYRSMDFVPADDNFSIAYATHNGKYFIFTTSKDSLTKIFDQLPK